MYKAGLPHTLHGQWGVGGTSKLKDLSEAHAFNFSLGRPLLGSGYGDSLADEPATITSKAKCLQSYGTDVTQKMLTERGKVHLPNFRAFHLPGEHFPSR